jgi:hypothetical protein
MYKDFLLKVTVCPLLVLAKQAQLLLLNSNRSNSSHIDITIVANTNTTSAWATQ